MGKPTVKVGDIFNINSGGKVEVVCYNSAKDIIVRFEQGHTSSVQAGNLLKGVVKNNYNPIVFGVGYYGTGEYSATENGKITKAYDTWHSMFNRCYMIRECGTTYYRDAKVCDYWHNFQNYAEWFYNNSNWSDNNPKFHLDKDILSPVGCREYSPEYCTFIPPELNSVVGGQGKSGKYKTGVTYHERLNKYEASCRAHGKGNYLGVFHTEDEAHAVYKEFKLNYIKFLANKYIDVLEPRVFDALLDFKLEEHD